MAQTVSVASIQCDVRFDDPVANGMQITDHLSVLAGEGVQVAVFPECALTGYCVGSPEEAEAIAIPLNHPSLIQIDAACQSDRIVAVVGFAEAGEGTVFNTAAVFAPGYPVRYYRKTHLPELGLDRFVTPGDEIVVAETAVARLGIMICFDTRHPELARCMALGGADMICVPTNWPAGATISADLLAPARAVENKVFVITSNRIGTENGFTFIGRSKIIDPLGTVLAAANEAVASVLRAELDLELARVKRNVTVPGVHETTVFESRRPELYAKLTHLK